MVTGWNPVHGTGSPGNIPFPHHFRFSLSGSLLLIIIKKRIVNPEPSFDFKGKQLMAPDRFTGGRLPGCAAGTLSAASLCGP